MENNFACRPVRDMDAADVAAPAEPNDEQMVITEAIVEAQDTTHPENEQVPRILFAGFVLPFTLEGGQSNTSSHMTV